MLDLLLSQIIFFPAALLCFLPMRNKLRFSPLKTTWIVGLSLSAATLFFSWLGARVAFIGSTNEDILLLILFPLFFVAYQLCVKAPARQTLAVFLAVVSLLSILTRITSRLYHVLTGSNPIGTRYETVLITISILASILLTHMFAKYGSLLIDRLDVPNVWYATIVFSATVFAFSMLLKPILEDPTIGKASSVFALLSQIVLLLFWFAMCVMFYFAVKDLMSLPEDHPCFSIIHIQNNRCYFRVFFSKCFYEIVFSGEDMGGCYQHQKNLSCCVSGSYQNVTQEAVSGIFIVGLHLERFHQAGYGIHNSVCDLVFDQAMIHPNHPVGISFINPGKTVSFFVTRHNTVNFIAIV